MSDDVRIKFSVDDQATGASQKIFDNIIKNSEQLGRHTHSTADALGEIIEQLDRLPVEKLGKGASEAKEFGKSMLALGSEILTTGTTITTLVKNKDALREIFQMIGTRGAQATGGLTVGAGVAVGGAAAIGAGLIGKQYFDNQKGQYDAEFWVNSQVPPGQAAADEATFAANEERIKREDRIRAQAKINEGVRQEQLAIQRAADDYVKDKQHRTSLIGAKPADAAEAEFRQSKEFGALTGTQAAESIRQLRENADLEDRITAKAKERAEYKQRMHDLDAKSASLAKSWIDRSMTEKQKGEAEKLEAFSLFMSGKLNPLQANAAGQYLNQQYAPQPGSNDKATKVRLDLGGNDNVYQSRFATRGLAGETSQLDLLKKLLHELQRGNHADRLDAKRLIDEMRRRGIDLTASSPI